MLERGYDKIIIVTRDLIALCNALALYFRMAKTKKEVIELILKEPDYFSNIKRQWSKLDQEFDDPNIFKFTLEDWNNFTFQTFNTLLDFLGFKKEGRPLLVPARVKRDWEGYSCSFLPKEYKVYDRIQAIRDGKSKTTE